MLSIVLGPLTIVTSANHQSILSTGYYFTKAETEFWNLSTSPKFTQLASQPHNFWKSFATSLCALPWFCRDWKVIIFLYNIFLYNKTQNTQLSDFPWCIRGAVALEERAPPLAFQQQTKQEQWSEKLLPSPHPAGRFLPAERRGWNLQAWGGPERNGRTARQLPGNARWRSPCVIRSPRSVTGPDWDPVRSRFSPR